MKTENVIVALSFDFAVETIGLYKSLIEQREFVMSKQLSRCGTSIGANVEEAIAAQCRRDFISKTSIASKEARETRYWLKLLDKTQFVSFDYSPYLLKIEHIINVITKIVKTTHESTIQGQKIENGNISNSQNDFS